MTVVKKIGDGIPRGRRELFGLCAAPDFLWIVLKRETAGRCARRIWAFLTYCPAGVKLAAASERDGALRIVDTLSGAVTACGLRMSSWGEKVKLTVCLNVCKVHKAGESAGLSAYPSV